MDRTACILGRRAPVAVRVPMLSPWLSSHWVHLVTRADWSVAREIVVGLTGDLLARDHSYWERIGHTRLQSFDEAARLAALEALTGPPVRGPWGVVERLLCPR